MENLKATNDFNKPCNYFIAALDIYNATIFDLFDMETSYVIPKDIINQIFKLKPTSVIASKPVVTRVFPKNIM